MLNQQASNVFRTVPCFGIERNSHRIYLEEIVKDRRTLAWGFRVIRDELDLADPPVGADFSKRSVLVTLAHTTCGDRANKGQPLNDYHLDVASRFATIRETGEPLVEEFFPIGGGVEDAGLFAHVTVGHASDSNLKQKLYSNPESFILYCFDIQSHVGVNGDYGRVQESRFRSARNACGAIVDCLSNYNPSNPVHRRISGDLGDENFHYLSSNRITAEGGQDITYAVAASVLSVRGMLKVMDSLEHELDDRGFAHLTASIGVNRTSRDDNVIYLARSIMSRGNVMFQGFGEDASLYAGKVIEHHGEMRLSLSYGHSGSPGFSVQQL
ncbi:hypothetical protein HYU11_06740 [Candidatus Woesearchaeota archaeon]|nr:hypothetical protein [Candidatus Woesearchaeota archaeon]